MRTTLVAPSDTLCLGSSIQLVAQGGRGSATFVWAPAEGLNTTQGPVVVASPTQTTTYTLTGYEGGCPDDTVFTLTVLPAPSADFLHTATRGCEGLTVAFQNQSTGAAGYYWQFGDGGVSNDPNPVYTYTQAGDYVARLVAGAFGGCQDTAVSAVIRVARPVAAAFSSEPPASEVLVLPRGTVRFTSQSEGAVQWLWEFGDGRTSNRPSPTYEFLEPGTYRVLLTVHDAGGCPDTTAAIYRVVAPEAEIPNVFSPNGDGSNDVFRVNYTGNQAVYGRIFDRWGILVYDSKFEAVAWNGKFNNTDTDTPAGVYFYEIYIGNRQTTGQVLLVR
jgi:gliding motility-associated-like protein